MGSERSTFRRVDLWAGVVAIALLAALAFPWIGNGSVDRVTCENRQIEIAQAVGRYVQAKQQYPGYATKVMMSGPDGGTQRRLEIKSWIVAVLETIDKEKFDAIKQMRDPQPKELMMFQCPLAKRTCEQISYVANCGRRDATDPQRTGPRDWQANGMFMSESIRDGGLPDDIGRFSGSSDGEERTLLISENLQAMRWTDIDEASVGMVWFAEPNPESPQPASKRINVGRDKVLEQSDYNYARPSSRHTGGVVATYCSGRTDFIADSIDYVVYCHLMTSDGRNAREPGSDQPTAWPYRE